MHPVLSIEAIRSFRQLTVLEPAARYLKQLKVICGVCALGVLYRVIFLAMKSARISIDCYRATSDKQRRRSPIPASQRQNPGGSVEAAYVRHPDSSPTQRDRRWKRA